MRLRSSLRKVGFYYLKYKDNLDIENLIMFTKMVAN